MEVYITLPIFPITSEGAVEYLAGQIKGEASRLYYLLVEV